MSAVKWDKGPNGQHVELGIAETGFVTDIRTSYPIPQRYPI